MPQVYKDALAQEQPPARPAAPQVFTSPSLSTLINMILEHLLPEQTQHTLSTDKVAIETVIVTEIETATEIETETATVTETVIEMTMESVNGLDLIASWVIDLQRRCDFQPLMLNQYMHQQKRPKMRL